MDKIEIENLGWLHDDCEHNNYVMGNWDLYHNTETNFVKIDGADGEHIVFVGIVNDIEELKNIMIEKNINK